MKMTGRSWFLIRTVPEWEGEMRPVIPRVIEDGTSEAFTAPSGHGEWLNAHSSDPIRTCPRWW